MRQTAERSKSEEIGALDSELPRIFVWKWQKSRFREPSEAIFSEILLGKMSDGRDMLVACCARLA